MKLAVATSRVNYSGPDRLDITVKSAKGAGRVLAPTWDMVMAVKSGRVTWAQYADSYYDLMRSRYQSSKGDFHQLVNMERIVLCCYCTDHTKCHRTLAADILRKVANSLDIEFEYEGEVT